MKMKIFVGNCSEVEKNFNSFCEKDIEVIKTEVGTRSNWDGSITIVLFYKELK